MSLVRQSGFTLVELLLAIAISAILAFYTTRLVGEMSTAQDRIEEQRFHVQQLQLAMSRIEQDMLQAQQQRSIKNEFGEYFPGLKLTPDPQLSITRSGWPRSLLLTAPRSEMQRVEYRLERMTEDVCRLSVYLLDRIQSDQLDGYCLVRRHWYQLDQGSIPEPRDISLLGYLEQMEIRVKQVPDQPTNGNTQAAKPEWRDHWPPANFGNQNTGTEQVGGVEITLTHLHYGELKRFWSIPTGGVN
jgi:general secretion pathway protein J